MTSFQDKIVVEYPVPKKLSIWFGDEVHTYPLSDFNLLISTVVDEISSDIVMTEYIEAQGIATYMPKETVSIVCAQLSSNMPFQGNRMVKVTYDQSKKIAYCRYFPAIITYQRKLKVEDLESLTGDRLIYIKCYILWKMAEKELSILKTTNFQVDNGVIDFSVLETFRDKMYQRYIDLKSEILLYNSSH